MRAAQCFIGICVIPRDQIASECLKIPPFWTNTSLQLIRYAFWKCASRFEAITRALETLGNLSRLR
jgi:hypothetical protein